MEMILRPLNGTWPRARKPPVRSQFDTAWSKTLRLLEIEIGHLVPPRHHGQYVVEIDVTPADIRRDGYLRANARPAHPGVIVSFESKHGPLRYIVDRFDHWQDNVRAIALGLESLRRVDRYGITTDGEQYRGWNALPPGRPMGAAMTVEDAARLLARYWPGADDGDLWANAEVVDVDAVQHAYRAAVKVCHPDHGGDPDEFARVTAARDLLVGGVG